MKKSTIIGLVLLAIVFFIGSLFVGSIIGINNELVNQEQIIKAQYDENRNNYDNFFKKVREVSQVPAMYTEDLKKVYDGVISNRYGKDGSQAMFQFIKEHNPNFDASLYKQIQQVIEAGRNDFETNQKMLIDKKRVYETMLNVFPKNILAKILGFPKIDLSKLTIITSDETEKAFQTKKSEPLKLR